MGFLNLYPTTLHCLAVFPLSIFMTYVFCAICWCFDGPPPSQPPNEDVAA